MRLSFIRFRGDSLAVRLTKLGVLVVPVLLVAILLNDHFFLSSQLHFVYHAGGRIGVVGPKSPTQILRTGDPKMPWRVTVDDFPVTVTVPRNIQAVRLQMHIQPSTQPYIALTAEEKGHTQTSTLINVMALNMLDWPHVSNGDVTLWMRTNHQVATTSSSSGSSEAETTTTPVQQYASIDAFQARPPDPASIGLVNIDRMAFSTVANYQPQTTERSIGHTLRGSHQFYTYAANETLSFSFDKIDLNHANGTDGVTVKIARVNNLQQGGRSWIKTVNVGDDGISGSKGPRGNPQHVSIQIPHATPGMYYIELNTSIDVLLANLSTTQQYLSFDGHITLADGPAFGQNEYPPVALQLTGAKATVQVNHEQAKQTILVGNKLIPIKSTKSLHDITLSDQVTSVNVPRGDVTIDSTGLISFRNFAPLTNGSDVIDVTTATPDLNAYDYILAKYIPNTADTIHIDQTFDLSSLSSVAKTYTFTLRAPGLQSAGATMGLRDIQATLYRGPFPWKKVWQKIGLAKT